MRCLSSTGFRVLRDSVGMNGAPHGSVLLGFLGHPNPCGPKLPVSGPVGTNEGKGTTCRVYLRPKSVLGKDTRIVECSSFMGESGGKPRGRTEPDNSFVESRTVEVSPY